MVGALNMVLLVGLCRMTDTTGTETMDRAHGQRLLEAVRDGVFSFDDPAFYWFCRYSQTEEGGRLLADADCAAPQPWKLILERPGDYRGAAVVIEGVVQSKYQYDVPNREGIGRLAQLELSDPASRSLCALVLTQDPGAVPVRSRVCVKGFFIKVRGYRTTQGEEGAGPLLVARALTSVQPPATGASPRSSEAEALNWLIGGVAAMALIWYVLRRGFGRAIRAAPMAKSGSRSPPTDADFDWIAGSRSTTERESK